MSSRHVRHGWASRMCREPALCNPKELQSFRTQGELRAHWTVPAAAVTARGLVSPAPGRDESRPSSRTAGAGAEAEHFTCSLDNPKNGSSLSQAQIHKHPLDQRRAGGQPPEKTDPLSPKPRSTNILWIKGGLAVSLQLRLGGKLLKQNVESEPSGRKPILPRNTYPALWASRSSAS